MHIAGQLSFNKRMIPKIFDLGQYFSKSSPFDILGEIKNTVNTFCKAGSM